MLKILLLLFCTLVCTAGDSIRPGLENLAWKRGLNDQQEEALVNALKDPLLAGKDVSAALQDWFDGRLAASRRDLSAARQKWQSGLAKLTGLPTLPPCQFPEPPDASFRNLTPPELLSGFADVTVQVVAWTVGGLQQYGLILAPAELVPGRQHRLILYCHGAAFGIPNSFCGWLAEHLVRQGYVVIAPAMRGEPLYQMQVPVNGQELVSEGEIENLDGEVDDCLAMLAAAWKLPYVKPDEFAMLGHSFGAGVGLLTAARAGDKAKAVVSYDAWLVNPQRFYWDRMRCGANNWLSWEDFCNQPVQAQLQGLKKRSIVHNAGLLQAKLLLFMGGGYDGSVFHLSHNDLLQELQRLNKPCQYVLVPDGDHNFVLRDGAPARFALSKQQEFLRRYFPAK